MPENEFDNITLNDTAFLTSQVVEKRCENYDNLKSDNIYDIKYESNNSKPTENFVSNSLIQHDKTILNLDTSLSTWGLPESVLMKYKEKGITNMFMWQVECLGNKKVLECNNNLVYSAPTSAGKTLVAEILALKILLEKQKKVIMILPFVSVVREKMFYFQDILSLSGIRVEGFMGSHKPPGGFKAVHLAICTIEKANSIINKLLEEGTLDEIGGVIIDEMHLLGDSSRGYLLELLLTKLRYMSLRNKEITIQLIGMSATLSNLDLLSKWLTAELYTTNFRPIPLNEYCIFSGEILNSDFKLYKRLKPTSELTEDSDNILQLCLETISLSCSVLIFCPTKNWCENLAQQISTAFLKLGKLKTKYGQCLREQLNTNAIIEILEQLKRCPVGLDFVLKKTVSFGVAFHHAGLTMDERDIIEGAFKNGALRVLVATSTLSSGVNLPAQRVIIRTPMFYGKPLDSLTYRQMIGRAGRMGKDTSGESILVCQKNDKRIAEELISAKLQPIESCLEGAGKLKRAILEVIASGVATTPEDVNLFTNCTLLAASVDGNLEENNPIEKSLEFLVNNEFIRLQKNEQGELKYIATNLAKACLSSCLPPEDGLALFEEIEKARQCLVLDTELHLLYLVTPYSVCNQWSNLDWMQYLNFWEKLSPSMKRVADLVGVQESFIFNATRGRINTSTSKQYHRLQIHRRFYTSLALQDLVNEVPLNEVAEKFQCSRGMLQSLQQSASMFAGMVTSFCHQLGWKCVEILISQFQDRLQFGIQHELLELMKLPNLNGPRARALYNAGIESLSDLAAVDVCKLENILLSSVPFESEREREGETAYDVEQKKKIRGIFITGKQGLTAREAANMLIKDSRKYLQLEIGAAVLKWENTETDSNSISSGRSSSCYSSSSMSPKSDWDKKDNQLSENLSVNSNIQILEENLETKNNSIVKNDNNIENKDDSYLNKNQYETTSENNSIIPNKTKSLINSYDQDTILQDYELNCDTFDDEVDVDSANSSESFSKISQSDCLDDNVNISNIESEDEENIKPAEDDEEYDLNIKSINENIEDDVFDKDWTPLNINIRLSSEFNKSDISVCNKSGSLFEESLNLDSKLCDALDSSFQTDCKNVENKQQSIKMEDTSFFDNFPNTLNVEENILNEEDINDLVETSQSEIKDCTLNSLYNSIKKRNDTPRKRNRNSEQGVCKELFETNALGTPKKKPKYDALDSNEVVSVDLTSIDIIDVCKNVNLFETFCTEIKTKSTISFTIACEYRKPEKSLIGQNIVNSPKNIRNEKNIKSNEFYVDERLITGVAISYGENVSYYLSLQNEEYVNNKHKIKLLQDLFKNEKLKVRIFDYKEQAKILYKFCKIIFCASVEDPKVVDWLLEPEGKEKNLTAMALKYSPEVGGICQLAGKSKGTGSIALDLNNSILSRIRSSVEALVTWYIVESQRNILTEFDVKLLNTFGIEMESVSCLVKMELTGLCIDKNKINKLIVIVQEQMAAIQRQAFSYAGRHFSFTSSKDVAKVLGIYKGKRVSTNKQTLEQNEHPVSKLILQWRKLNSTLTKMMYPILRSLKHDRIHGYCVTHTSTGRISMHEPNLQNVPRNFDVIKLDKTVVALSPRASFVAGEGNIFLSADYCQLELRLLAHMSQDSVLCNIMKSKEDVFKSIAAKVNKIPEESVTDELRQRAKQLCYGIIYGIGIKALSEQLNTSEEEAAKFIAGFKNTYPKIQQFIQTTIERCKEKGYVETLSGRKRYLSHINDENTAIKTQAERQAVNTTIQGSAADIAKMAMVAINKKLCQHFPSDVIWGESKVMLVLHLHDELLYELPINNLKSAAKLVKEIMEKSVKLSIPFPVKLKYGSSWGELEEYFI